MKHRHKLSQRQRQRPASQSRRPEAQETDEQSRSGAGKAKKSSMLHMKAEGGRTKLRMDKFRRGGRSRNRYDNGGPAGSSAASTRSADDPGGELATANRERKSTLGRIQDELLGPKSAYKRGGRPKHRGYDAGGATPPPIAFGSPSLQDIALTQAKPPCGDDLKRICHQSIPPEKLWRRGGRLRLPPCRKTPQAFPVHQRFQGASKVVVRGKEEPLDEAASQAAATAPETGIREKAAGNLRRSE